MTTEPPPARLAARLPRTAGILVAAGAVVTFASSGIAAAVSLTAPALVVIVHVLWLESFLARILAEENPRLRPGEHFKIFGQFLFLAALAALAHLWPGFSPAAAGLGVSLVVVAIITEGFRTPI